LLLQAAIPLVVDTLFDHSCVIRQQNQWVHGGRYCQWGLQRSFSSVCYWRSIIRYQLPRVNRRARPRLVTITQGYRYLGRRENGILISELCLSYRELVCDLFRGKTGEVDIGRRRPSQEHRSLRSEGCLWERFSPSRVSGPVAFVVRINRRTEVRLMPSRRAMATCLTCRSLLRHVRHTVSNTRWASMGFAVAPGLRNASFDTLAQNLALKLRKNGQETSHRPPGRRGEIQGCVE
jgi:hypothetical protein